MTSAVKISLTFASFVALACISGCASYAAPGRAADLARVVPSMAGTTSLHPKSASADPIELAFEKRPLAKFPAAVAIVRVQAPGYRSSTAHGWGNGHYSIVTTRDIEKPEHFERLAKLPQLHGLAPLGRLLINGKLDSDLPLRRAAAQLQADMLLIYTLDTTFTTEDKVKPLSVISLGLSPNKQVRVTSTASAVLLDTRNAYVYGLAEATAQEKRMTSTWQNDVAIDESRRKAEEEAFAKLVTELENTWKKVIAANSAAAGARE